MLPIEANGSPDPDTPDQPPDPAPQHAGTIECLLNRPGIAGLVLKSGTLQPVANVTVNIYDASNKLQGSVTTDQDGWFMWNYKYTGKAQTFTVKVPAYNLSQSATLKSNGARSATFLTGI